MEHPACGLDVTTTSTAHHDVAVKVGGNCVAEAGGARVILTADHGNADVMVDPVTGAPHTAHTTNPVPLIIVDPDGVVPLRAGGALCDVGPTVLELLGLTVPTEMTGRSLRLATVTA